MPDDVETLVGRLAAEGQTDVLGALEALADDRIVPASGLAATTLSAELSALQPDADPAAVVRELAGAGVLESPGGLALAPEVAVRARAALDGLAVQRTVTWADAAVRQGALLAAFAAHCRDELDDVDVLAAEGPSEELLVRLRLRWKREETRVELRHGLVLARTLAPVGPILLVADLEAAGEAWLRELAADRAARAAVSVWDPHRLEKASAVRSSVLVYFEWFLREAYGVRLAASVPFTQALVETGALHLGFG